MLSLALWVALLGAAGDTMVVMPQRQELLSCVPMSLGCPFVLSPDTWHRACSSAT